MYSLGIQKLLDSAEISIGGRILVKAKGKVYEGLLMPRPDIGDSNCIVLKLDNGYNIGIRIDRGSAIEKSGHKEPKTVKEEEEFELGKIKKSLLKVSFDPEKPPIAMISTGGTVASRVDYQTGGVSAMMDPKEFLHNVPELFNIVNIKNFSKPFTKMSEDMDSSDWIALAKLVAKELNSDNKGVIITHGTDTLHYTAAALSFMLPNLLKPVIIMGSQKSSDRPSSDAVMNLICSSHAAVSDIAEVAVCMHGNMNDDYCLLMRGTKVRKMHTVRRDAFRPINDLPLAKVWPSGKLEIVNKSYRKRSDQKIKADAVFEEKVAIVKAYPGSEPSILEYLQAKGYRGFVVEGLGLGHVPTDSRKSWIEIIKKLVKDGIPVVVTSQTIYGRINPNTYTNLRRLYHYARAIPGEDMLTEVAYVKLGHVLAKTKDMDEIRRLMLTNMAGEITPRTVPDAFLY
ncbi:MAG: Glu-tRNA(Gln) amidotransferase subunit GatD [Candidatus Aenigmarchaeota archaeon]|nr:Glu-tRNA(Gln) amidotransferase subunit GatD [Candidatus Aenigmarchaeota archaeon]